MKNDNILQINMTHFYGYYKRENKIIIGSLYIEMFFIVIFL